MFDIKFNISGTCHVPDADFELPVSEIEDAIEKTLADVGVEAKIYVSNYESHEVLTKKDGK